MRPRILAAWALGLIVATSGSALAQSALTQGDQLFAQARHTWFAQKYPAYIDYDVAVSVTSAGTATTEQYTSAFNATDNTVWVDPYSDWEIAHPAIVSGMNISIPFVKAGRPLAPEDFLNVPLLSPTYSFGIAPFVAMPVPRKPTAEELVAAVRTQFNDPNPRATATPTIAPDSGLKTIADVSAVDRHYNIALVGDDTVDGHDCYHLSLQPLAKAHVYRLRDIWIDRTDFRTWQLNVAYNFNAAPGTDVPWTVTFAEIGDAQYVLQERADAPISINGLLYKQASIAFENIRPRATPVAPMQYPPAHLLTEP